MRVWRSGTEAPTPVPYHLSGMETLQALPTTIPPRGAATGDIQPNDRTGNACSLQLLHVALVALHI